MQKFSNRGLIAIIAAISLSCTITACGPRASLPDRITAEEYHESSKRANRIEQNVTDAAPVLAEAMRDGKFGAVSLVGPGMVISQEGTVEFALKKNGKPSKRPIRIVLEQTDEHPWVSFSAPSDGYPSWDVCHGGCSRDYADDLIARSSRLEDIDNQAIAVLNGAVDNLG